MYFTDPPFGLPKFYDDPRKELDFSGVYRAKNGKVSLLTKELKGPNGIAFSPDEKFLYVGNWDPANKVVLRFPVLRDGTLGKSAVFIDLTQRSPGRRGARWHQDRPAGQLVPVRARRLAYLFERRQTPRDYHRAATHPQLRLGRRRWTHAIPDRA